MQPICFALRVLMRSSVVSVIALACAALTGCTSSSGVDSIMLQSKTSAETTSSVVRPVPPAPLSEMVSASQPMPAASQEEVLAWAGPIQMPGHSRQSPQYLLHRDRSHRSGRKPAFRYRRLRRSRPTHPCALHRRNDPESIATAFAMRSQSISDVHRRASWRCTAWMYPAGRAISIG